MPAPYPVPAFPAKPRPKLTVPLQQIHRSTFTHFALAFSSFVVDCRAGVLGCRKTAAFLRASWGHLSAKRNRCRDFCPSYFLLSSLRPAKRLGMNKQHTP